LRWYGLAADQGNASALQNLGDMYAAGDGVKLDRVQAHKWLSLAAARYSAAEAMQRDAAVKSRDALLAKMTISEVAAAEKQAREWRPR